MKNLRVDADLAPLAGDDLRNVEEQLAIGLAEHRHFKADAPGVLLETGLFEQLLGASRVVLELPLGLPVRIVGEETADVVGLRDASVRLSGDGSSVDRHRQRGSHQP